MGRQTRQVDVVVTTAVFCTLAITAVSVRLYARVAVIHNAKFDEVFLLVSLIALVLYNAFVCCQLSYGLGKHIDTVPVEHLSSQAKFLWASVLAYNTSFACTRLSILVQYLRFLSTPRYRFICWVVIGLIAAYGIGTVLDTIFLCRPIRGFWDPAVAKFCINKEVLWLVHSGLNIACDLIIIIIPIPQLLHLKSSKRQRLGVLLILNIGIIVTVITILRINALITVTTSPDLTWANAAAAIWSNAEITAAIVCASLPGMRPLFKSLSGRNRRSSLSTQVETGTQGTAPLSTLREFPSYQPQRRDSEEIYFYTPTSSLVTGSSKPSRCEIEITG